jgi:hypothetical protein
LEVDLRVDSHFAGAMEKLRPTDNRTSAKVMCNWIANKSSMVIGERHWKVATKETSPVILGYLLIFRPNLREVLYHVTKLWS